MAVTHTPAPPPDAPQGQQHLPIGERRHETTDASLPIIFWVVVGLVAGIALAELAVWGYITLDGKYSWWGHPPAPPPPDVRPLGAPAPRLQVNEALDLEATRNSENQQIATYGWVDKKYGVVRIPIARAMDLVTQRGLPDFASEQQPGEKEAPKVPWEGRKENPPQEPKKTNIR